MKFDSHLLHVLTRKNFDEFTVSEAMDAYAQVSGSNTPVDSNWMYCQLRRLTRKGMLKKEKLTSPYRVIYRKTDRFDLKPPAYRSCRNELRQQIAPTSVSESNFIELMNERAKSIKVEILSTISEGEEYKSLMEEYPFIRSRLEEKYQASCLQSAKALGRLTAIEAVITEYSA